MAMLIDQIDSSGLFAQSAYSAAVATNDSLGRIISETYLTSVPTGYATTNDLEQVSGDITALIPSTAGLASESYVQTNSAVLTGMIDAKQDTLTFGYDEQDRINSINNSALAGGGEVPEGTMVESNLEYNSQGFINGYGGSAVATVDCERQWFTHDSTLTHLSNSSQYALGVNMSAISADLARMMGVDETVIYENATGAAVNSANVITLNESLQNFEMIKIIDNTLNAGGCRRLTTIPVSTATRSIATNDAWFDISYQPTSNASKYIGANFYSANDAGTQIRMNGSYINHMANTGAWAQRNDGHLYKIIGVHRISGGI